MQIKTTMRYYLTSVRMVIIKETRNNKCWQGYGEKGNLLHGGNVNWNSHCEKQWGGLSKNLKIERELPYDSAIPLLYTFLKKTKTLIRKDICTPMSIAALFTKAKIWQQPKCPSLDERIKKL